MFSRTENSKILVSEAQASYVKKLSYPPLIESSGYIEMIPRKIRIDKYDWQS